MTDTQNEAALLGVDPLDVVRAIKVTEPRRRHPYLRHRDQASIATVEASGQTGDKFSCDAVNSNDTSRHRLRPPFTQLKAKGVGELGICGIGAAIANAIYNATGVRARDYPITLDKLLDRLPGPG